MASRIRELARQLRAGERTTRSLVEESFRQIDALEPTVHAFITLTKESALEDAVHVDAQLEKGAELPLLAGIPYALKDLLCTAGLRTTAGSRILESFVPPYDAHVVARLREQHAVIVGKTNQDEFAMGSSTETSFVGPTRNPHDPTRVAGGTSGGSAAAVAADMVPFALGTDTGGSIRQPASFCGVVGMKPTYGRVSRYGVIAYASSFDQVGPLANTVEDAAIVYEAIAGPDAKDSTMLPDAPPSVLSSLHGGMDGIRVGVPKEFFGEGIDPEVEAVIRTAIRNLENAGASIEEVSLPLSTAALPTYYVLVCAEASTNLARYDGVRYGRRVSASTIDEIYTRSRGEGFGTEVKRRIMLGTFTLSSGYADKYYRKAAAVRQEIIREYAEIFKQVDVLVGPVAPEVAFPLGSRTEDPLRMYLSDILSVSANVAGVPALVVPAGTAHGLPVGLQVTAAQGREDLCFRVGAAYETLRGSRQ